MKKIALALCLLLTLGLLAGCRRTDALEGTYAAVNPPVESGELVIQEVSFHDGQVTMISGDVQQTVDYRIKDGKLTLLTKFGDFSYDFAQKDAQTITIDALDYVRK